MKKLLLAVCLSFLALNAKAAQIPLITGPQDVAGLQATLNSIIQQINNNVVLTSSNNPASGTGVLMALNPNGTVPIGGTLPANASLVVNTVTTANVPSAVNMVSITGSTTNANAPADGVSPIIAVTGTDTNINLAIQTQGAGLVQFASAPMWIPARNGLATCPGTIPGNPAGLGVSNTVSGYLLVEDWLGRTHAIPSC